MRFRHRDAFGRIRIVSGKDARREQTLDPSDGRLVELLVQGTQQGDLYSYGHHGSWTRIGPPRMRISSILGLMYWLYSSVLIEGSERRRNGTKAVLAMALKWIPSCLLVVVMLFVPQSLEGEIRNNGFYHPVHYRDWKYPKVARNKREARSAAISDDPDGEHRASEQAPLLDGDNLEMTEFSQQATGTRVSLGTEDTEDLDELRGFGPRYLCFLLDVDSSDPSSQTLPYRTMKFIVATSAEIALWNIPTHQREAYGKLAEMHRRKLLQYGIEAARSAGKSAFWIDFECIRDVNDIAEATSQSYDVYRICDIVRAADSMVIVAGPSFKSQLPGRRPEPYTPANMTMWLQQWGTRLWTLPEILLCSHEHRIKLFAAGAPVPPEQVAKRNFAARANLPDAKRVRQLIDHYESSIVLSRLELVSLALQCFSIRQTDIFNKGDTAYALQGLLRRRPIVNRDDTSFEAFARLSLANDNDALLERLICMQPQSLNMPWYKVQDAWGAYLWDIQPRCQIAGIVDDQTVTLDGAFGAQIQWDFMDQVAFLKRPTLMRLFAKIALRGVPAYLLLGLVLMTTGAVLKSQSQSTNTMASESESDDNSNSSISLALLIPGLIILVPALIVMLASPAMLFNIYGGKFWSTQALFIGIEGIPDPGFVERHLFGFNFGRLKWSVAGSTLSQHALSINGECEALPPTSHLEKGTSDGESPFTLVDTYSMTATTFYAAHPPTSVMVCGQEGGMQRAVLCSYDAQESTFAREVIIRMETKVLDRMFRVPRFRFALRRLNISPQVASTSYDDSEMMSYSMEELDDDGSQPRSSWNIDLALLPFMWFVYGAQPLLETNNYPYDGSVLKAIVASNSIGWAVYLILQFANYFLFRHVKIGTMLGLAVLGQGVVGIAIAGLIFTEPSWDGSYPAEIVLHLLQQTASAVIVPCFVLLTAAWYDGLGSRVGRLLVWTCGQAVLGPIVEFISLASVDAYQTIQLVIAVLCVFLAAYCFMYVDLPPAVGWPRPDQRAGYAKRREWYKSLVKKKKLLALLRSSNIWLLFLASLFTGSLVEGAEKVLYPYNAGNAARLAETSFPPLLVILGLGALFVWVRLSRVLIVALTAILWFTVAFIAATHGGVVYGDGVAHGADGMLQIWAELTMVLGYWTQYFIWCILVATHGIQDASASSLVPAICTTFAGYSLGGIIAEVVFGLVIEYSGPHDAGSPQLVVYLAVTFALLMVVLILWFLSDLVANWRSWRGRNSREVPVLAEG